MSALLLVGSDTSLRIDDRKSRSRQFLRQALLLSGAIHLSLLFVFLSLTSRGDEGLVRIYRNPGILLPPPVNHLQPLPPETSPGDVSARRQDAGRIDPVEEEIKKPPLPDPGDLSRMLNRPPARPTTGSGNNGDPDPKAASVIECFPINEVDEPPVAVYSPTPVYPEIAREMYFTGRVVLKVLVGDDGTVRKVEVLSGPRLLAESALETLYRWRFRPARVQGKPVSVWLEVPVQFVM